MFFSWRKQEGGKAPSVEEMQHVSRCPSTSYKPSAYPTTAPGTQACCSFGGY